MKGEMRLRHPTNEKRAEKGKGVGKEEESRPPPQPFHYKPDER